MVSEAPTMIDLTSVPESQHDVVARVLEEEFSSGVEHIEAGPSGASGAGTYRVEASDGTWLLRVESDRLPGRNPHQYRNLRAAADAGIAPPVRIAEDSTGVLVMQWVETRPLAEHPGGPDGLVRDLGELIGELQSLEPFPAHDDWAEVIANMLAFLDGSAYAHGVLDGVVAAYDEIRAATPRDPSTFVPSHNDPNGRNLLYDGERLWLVDWETSSPNDPLVDLAVVANEMAPTRELRDALLTASRGAAPDDVTRARLVLTQQAAKLFAASALSFASLDGEPRVDLVAPSMADFGARVATGELTMGDPEMLSTLARVVFNDVLTTTASPAFAEALRISSDG